MVYTLGPMFLHPFWVELWCGGAYVSNICPYLKEARLFKKQVYAKENRVG